MNRFAARLAASLLLLGFGTGCDRVPMPNLSFLHATPPPQPLRDVLPGRWKAVYKGITYTITFGRHSDVAYVMDVPQEYRARLGADQLWIGGNYHLENDHVINCQLTDGRWAEILAQMHGLKLHRIGIKTYGENEFIDGEDVTWKRIAKAASVHMGDAVDIADQTPTINDAPRAKPANARALPPTTLYDQQNKLTVLYQRLEEKRRKLNPKNKAAVAEFNKEAAEYSRQVAALNAVPVANGNAPGPVPVKAVSNAQ